MMAPDTDNNGLDEKQIRKQNDHFVQKLRPEAERDIHAVTALRGDLEELNRLFKGQLEVGEREKVEGVDARLTQGVTSIRECITRMDSLKKKQESVEQLHGQAEQDLADAQNARPALTDTFDRNAQEFDRQERIIDEKTLRIDTLTSRLDDLEQERENLEDEREELNRRDARLKTEESQIQELRDQKDADEKEANEEDNRITREAAGIARRQEEFDQLLGESDADKVDELFDPPHNLNEDLDNVRELYAEIGRRESALDTARHELQASRQSIGDMERAIVDRSQSLTDDRRQFVQQSQALRVQEEQNTQEIRDTSERLRARTDERSTAQSEVGRIGQEQINAQRALDKNQENIDRAERLIAFNKPQSWLVGVETVTAEGDVMLTPSGAEPLLEQYTQLRDEIIEELHRVADIDFGNDEAARRHTQALREAAERFNEDDDLLDGGKFNARELDTLFQKVEDVSGEIDGIVASHAGVAVPAANMNAQRNVQGDTAKQYLKLADKIVKLNTKIETSGFWGSPHITAAGNRQLMGVDVGGKKARELARKMDVLHRITKTGKDRANLSELDNLANDMEELAAVMSATFEKESNRTRPKNMVVASVQESRGAMRTLFDGGISALKFGFGSKVRAAVTASVLAATTIGGVGYMKLTDPEQAVAGPYSVDLSEAKSTGRVTIIGPKGMDITGTDNNLSIWVAIDGTWIPHPITNVDHIEDEGSRIVLNIPEARYADSIKFSFDEEQSDGNFKHLQDSGHTEFGLE